MLTSGVAWDTLEFARCLRIPAREPELTTVLLPGWPALLWCPHQMSAMAAQAAQAAWLSASLHGCTPLCHLCFPGVTFSA